MNLFIVTVDVPNHDDCNSMNRNVVGAFSSVEYAREFTVARYGREITGIIEEYEVDNASFTGDSIAI